MKGVSKQEYSQREHHERRMKDHDLQSLHLTGSLQDKKKKKKLEELVMEIYQLKYPQGSNLSPKNQMSKFYMSRNTLLQSMSSMGFMN